MDFLSEDDVQTMFFQLAENDLSGVIEGISIVQDYKPCEERIFYPYGSVFRSFETVSGDVVRVRTIYPTDIVERIMSSMGYINVTNDKALRKLIALSATSLDSKVGEDFLELTSKGYVVEH